MEKRFVVDRKSLLDALSSMQPICTKRTTLNLTNFILFQINHKELILKGTDLEISLQATCAVEESSFSDFESFLISGRRVYEIVRELDEKITFEIEESRVGLKSGSVSLFLNTQNAREFPPFPERIENLMHLDADHFLKMLSAVSFLIPQNNVNPALNGLLLEISPDGMVMTSTDGHCLIQASSSKYEFAESKSWLLPRRAVIELKKILEICVDEVVFLGICGNQLVFSGDLFNFFTKLLAAPFPQYKPILDRTSFIASRVDRVGFLKALKRSATLLSGNFLATKFTFSPNSLHVSMKNKDVGSLDEEVTIDDFEKKKLDMRFYAPYLLSGLQVFNDENLSFYLKDGSKPILFESGFADSGNSKDSVDLTLKYLVMPVAKTSDN